MFVKWPILMGELLFGTVLPLQGDVLLLGWLTDTTTVGYYALGGTVAAALAAVGQSFVMTYHEPLRNSGGDLSTGPKLRTTIALGVGIGIVTLLIGVGLLLSPAPPADRFRHDDHGGLRLRRERSSACSR